MRRSKAWWKSRTLWICLLQIVAGILTLPGLKEAGGALLASGIAHVILRVITTGPIGQDDSTIVRRGEDG